MRINKTLINTLLALINGESIPSSKCKGGVFESLIEEGVLLPKSHGSRVSYYAPRGNEVKDYIECHFSEMADIEGLKMKFDEKESMSRADLVKLTGDSKTISHRSCQGFLVNSLSPICCSLCGNPFVVNPQEGSYVFVASPDTFIVPDDVVVVGIENMENFYEIRKQKSVFSQIHSNIDRILFVSRYPQNNSQDLQQWLSKLPNKYVHFGDFDMAGVNIYQTEFLKHIGIDRCSFFVPDDIENRIKLGNTKLYNKQYPTYKNLEVIDMRVKPLIEMIMRYHKCYEQEGYIEK